jgi:hypothetical protein
VPQEKVTKNPVAPSLSHQGGSPRPKAVVSGALANKPFNGGNAWTRLSWTQGLRQLGFDVFFVEQIVLAVCVDHDNKPASFCESTSALYFRRVMEQFGLSESSALLLDGGREVLGCSLSELRDWADQAELLINIGGHLSLADIRDRASRRVYFDDDPGYTQFWQAMGGDASHLDEHDHFYTLGFNIGQPECSIPTQGVPWRPINPPVVLSDWPVTPHPALDRFSTVASWRGSYGPVYHGGIQYGLKVHEFRKFMELPGRCQQSFEIALQIHAADEKDRLALLEEGWAIRDAAGATPYPEDFRAYVQASAAEFSVAQGIYVQTNSGWFSDRTVRYLTSGRPALVQDTGFSRHLPVGSGLCTFRTLEEAAIGARSIAQDYQHHCQEARRIAEQYFDSDKVIGNLLTDIGVKHSATQT